MLINHNTKQYWWGPPRTGSREVGRFLKRWGWEEIGGHHHVEVVDGYELFVSCRNPYSRAVSWWVMRTKMVEPLIDQDGNRIWMMDNSTFKEWIMNPNEYSEGVKSHDYVVKLIRENNLKFNPIRLEHIEEDMSKLGPYVNEGKAPWDLEKSQKIRPYGEYYTQEIADRVWDFARGEFHQFGYEKDSWKYLDI